MLATTGGAGKEEESVVVGGGDHLLPAVLGGGDHRVLHAFTCQEQMVGGGARHSFAWVPCNNQEVSKYWKERERQEEMKGGVDTCGGGQLTVTVG